MIPEHERSLARRRIDDFARRRGDGALDLACHAALPVVIDAELIHLLRLNFFADPGAPLPFTAEADVLLSTLCADIGGGLYEIAPAVRATLIERLGVRHGLERPREVALLLFRYGERRHPWAGRPRLERAQQLTALGFLDPQRAAAWLERAKTEGGEFPVEGRAWFMAMRQELKQVAVAHSSTETATPAVFDPRGREPEPGLRWVLVVGTANTDIRDVEQRACRGVGRALARAGYGLITCDYWGVDHAVAKAFTEALDPDQSVAHRLLHVVTQNHHTQFHGGTVLMVPSTREVMIQSVARSDAVVVIGGVGKTTMMASLAREQGRPVFPLGYTGGAARMLHKDQVLHNDMPRAPEFAMTEDDLRALSDERLFRVERLLELIGGLLSPKRTEGLHPPHPPPTGPVQILFLAANPSVLARRALEREVREIMHRLHSIPHNTQFEIDQEWAVRVEDLRAALLRHQPDIVHFSGHGRATGELLVEDETGNAVAIQPSALAGLFSIFHDNIRCVVLNACAADAQVMAIGQHIDCVVALSAAITDATAVNFSSAFYLALRSGRSVKEAFDLGRNQIALEGMDRSELPLLLCREGVRPEELRLVQPP